MTRLIYGLAAVEAAVLLFFAGQHAFGPGTATSSGGAAMGLFFFVLVPLAILLLATATFRFAPWRGLRAAAALAIAGPPVVLLLVGLNDAAQRSADDTARQARPARTACAGSPAVAETSETPPWPAPTSA